MANVKCKLCGTSIEKDFAYKVSKVSKTSGKTINSYYCSKEEYEQFIQKEEDKDKVYRLICYILNVRCVTNTSLWKEKAIWNEVADDKTVYLFLNQNKDKIAAKISKLSGGEYSRIRYLSAVVKNSIADFKDTLVHCGNEPSFISIDEGVVTKHKPKKRRVAFEDLEDEYE